MPTYVYGLDKESNAAGCAMCQEHFDAERRITDDPLAKCPACGAPIVRVIQVPNLGNIGGKLKGPSGSDLQKAGFTQYKRTGKGHYEKSFGKGPAGLGLSD